MLNLVSGLPREALDWRPAADAASLAGLALHILDVEGYLASLARGDEIAWAGENGSRMGETATDAELVAAIGGVDAAIKHAFAAMDAERTTGDSRAVGAVIGEEIDHVSMHYGQMQLTRHLWEATHPESPSDYRHWR